MIKTTFVYDEQALVDFFSFHLKRKDKIRWIYYAIALVFFILGIIVAFAFKKQFMGLIILISSTIMFMVFPSQAKRAAKRTSSSRYTMLGINPAVHLVPPKTIVRSEGKAVRVVDKRKLI